MVVEEALLQVFEERASAAGAVLHRCEANAAAVIPVLRRLCGDHQAVASTFPFVDPQLAGAVLAMPGLKVDPDEATLAAGPVGITDAFAGVAETGSVALSNVQGLNGPVSLFTHRHIVLLESWRMVARPRDLFTRTDWMEHMLNMVFITGPSATADMGKLVRGVHGPTWLDIVLLDVKEQEGSRKSLPRSEAIGGAKALTQEQEVSREGAKALQQEQEEVGDGR